MASRKFGFIMLLALSFCLGCQPAPNNSSNFTSTGRGARTTSVGAAVPSGKTWGAITSSAGDAAFDQELYYLTYPTLSNASASDQLGYVSSQSGQATGVRFWGNAHMVGANVDSTTMMLRLDIYDDRTGQTDSDGNVIPDIGIQISPDQPTFVTAGGTVNGTTANLYFQDTYGTITLTGDVSTQNFTGTITYQDNITGNQPRTLGNFTVPLCGFFQCN
jgi:hypothetical protein